MGKWKALLDNAPEGATHVDLIFPDQMQRGIGYKGMSCRQAFYKKSSKGVFYRYDTCRGYYETGTPFQGRISKWRLLRAEDQPSYLISLDTVRIMIRQFEGSK